MSLALCQKIRGCFVVHIPSFQYLFCGALRAMTGLEGVSAGRIEIPPAPL